MKTASFTFTVLSPFWQKWWFIGICTLVIAASLYQLFRFRLSVVSKREQEKARVQVSIIEMEAKALRSQMNPHFMFNSFNSIQSYILQNETKLANYYLGKFSKLMRQMLESSKHDNTTLTDEINLLTSYIELEKMRHNDCFEYEIVVEKKLDAVHIRIPIMLIQSQVENAILHGLAPLKERPGKLSIHFEQRDLYLKCTIEDNGIGRKAAAEINRQKRRFHNSVSSTLTIERLELYNKIHKTNAGMEYVDLCDENDQAIGTKVILLIPIINAKEDEYHNR
jgi:LytS/YehU family sensor histidine kinase